jgi:dihydrolipoamide dehydrogenase
VAKVIGEARAAREWGVTYGDPKIDVEKLRGWKNGVVEKLTGGLGQLVQRRKIHHVRGTAVFSDENTLSIDTLEGKKQDLRFEQAIIATGSHPVAVPGFDFDSKHVIHAKGALSIPDIPKKLLVVGGGYIGLELGSFYAAIGSKVTVVEMTPNLLPGVDKDLVRVLQKKAFLIKSYDSPGVRRGARLRWPIRKE